MEYLIKTSDWIRFFPYPKVRPEQEQIINQVLNSYLNPNIKFAIVDAPTGIGKSAIGYTVAKFMLEHPELFNNIDSKNKAYFLTSQKMLQDQYIKDYSDIFSIKSKSNYSCMNEKVSTCEEGSHLKESLNEIDPILLTSGERCCLESCTYKSALKTFIRHPLNLTNYQYYLNSSKSETVIKYANLLVLDEGHLLENELWRFIEVEISERFVNTELKLLLETNIEKVPNWINTTLMNGLRSHIDYLRDTGNRFKENQESDAYVEIMRRIELYSNYIEQIKSVLFYYEQDKSNYIFDIIDFTDRRNNETFKKIIIKPVNVSPYTDSFLFSHAKHVLIMSATIGNVNYYRKNMGINPHNSIDITVGSPFKPENRPILYMPVGSMGYKSIEETLPKMASFIKDLLNEHKDEKGVIFCNSYKISSYIQRNIRNNRLIFHDGENRLMMLDEFIKSKQPKVFVAVAMSTGLDLKNDLSRFQIICKVPFPFLGDKQVTAKKASDPDWYGYVTALDMIQTFGRSVRNEDDYATTYILDSDFGFLYSKNKHLFPSYIQEAIHKH